MIKLISLFICLFVLALPLHAQSALETLANSMQPGTWAELQTSNESILLNPGSGGSAIIIPYAMTQAYDPVRRQVHFLGADHALGSDPSIGYSHVRYDLASNAWVRLGHPSWYNMVNDAHGYDLTTIAGRKLIRQPYNTGLFREFDLDSNDTTNPANWITIPSPFGNYIVNAVEYFPERNSIIWLLVDGAYEYSLTTNTFADISPLNPTLGLNSTWRYAIYNPIRHEILAGGSTNKLWTYSPSGVWTQKPDVPATYRSYDGFGYNGLWTVDPVTGKYLILTDASNGTGRNFYEYDITTDTYSPLATIPNKNLSGNFVVAPIPEYGVTMWTWARGSSGGATGVFLYKHGAGSPPTNTPPSVSAGADISVVLPATASLGGTVSDDGLPSGTLTRIWTGPIGVTFTNAATPNATATFAGPGSYTLTLTGNDGALMASDSIVATVGTAPSPKLIIPFDTTSQGTDGKFYRIQGSAVEQ